MIFRGRNCKPDNRTVLFNDTELYSTQDYPLLVILKQRFSKIIHKAMNHNSPIIKTVLLIKLSIANPWSNYRHILNECDTMYDVSVYDIGRVWQAGLSNATISNVHVLSEILDIRNGFKTSNILDDEDVNCIITDITVF